MNSLRDFGFQTVELADHAGYWVQLPLPHQALRALAIRGAPVGFDVDDLLFSYVAGAEHLGMLGAFAFEPGYRRVSASYRIETYDDLNVEARANPEARGASQLSRGFLLAIEDACQTVVTDRRSRFASNVLDLREEALGISPEVAWLPEAAPLLDRSRYADYTQIVQIARGVRPGGATFGLLHRMVSQSAFRQSLGDLLSTFALLWVAAHEDAHVHLGHVETMNALFGAAPGGLSPFLETFMKGGETQEDAQRRLSAELAADSTACAVLMDHVFKRQMVSAHPFLYRHLERVRLGSREPGEERAHAVLGSEAVYLFRLAVASVVIVLAVFERYAVKKSAFKGTHPSLGMRILNAVFELSGRAFALQRAHPYRELGEMALHDWRLALSTLSPDIGIVLRYFFEQGFVLQDDAIAVQSPQEVVEFDLNRLPLTRLLFELGLLAGAVVTDPEMLEGKPLEHRAMLRTFLDAKLRSLRDQADVFGPSRMEANRGQETAVHESEAYERELSERLAAVRL